MFSKCIFLFGLLFTALSLVSAAPIQQTSSLTRRGWSGIGTWFHVGLGNCGWTNIDSDWLVALPTQAYENGAHCGKTISINVGDQTVHAVVADSCPSCGDSDIDLSPSLFGSLADLGKGTINLNWWID